MILKIILLRQNYFIIQFQPQLCKDTSVLILQGGGRGYKGQRDISLCLCVPHAFISMIHSTIFKIQLQVVEFCHSFHFSPCQINCIKFILFLRCSSSLITNMYNQNVHHRNRIEPHFTKTTSFTLWSFSPKKKKKSCWPKCTLIWSFTLYFSNIVLKVEMVSWREMHLELI